ncbi:MAG TPA: hypothetical protein VEC56_03585 [Candidatus Krumholzibacteria bacterium]|nr:hypothetical protein [Candidatus Krumholzibacteria bacterium]
MIAGCRANGSEREGVAVTCGTVLGLDAENAARKDWSGETREWSAEAIGDTLRLVRKGRCGDECTFVDEIVLAGLSARCPSLVRATTTRRDAGSPVPGAKIVEAQHGSLAIQDWDARGVVSGRLVAEISLMFYVTLAKEE